MGLPSDGKYLATASSNKTANIWEVSSIPTAESTPSSQADTVQPQQQEPATDTQPVETPQSDSQPAVATPDDSGLSNDKHYVNSAGNVVHSPAYSNNGAVPQVATAVCKDGTCSFSQSRRGTCSSHGGVSQWLQLALEKRLSLPY
ncbi:MAG: DUF3761 domain-containing protein [Rubrobacter sp.]|nr:DUF3761 domain-containing protein [Rubrobacter sp.]